MNKKLSEVLKSFNHNQIKQINDFLSSQDGAKLKSRLEGADKAKLLNELERIDPKLMQGRLKNLSREDIEKIIRSL